MGRHNNKLLCRVVYKGNDTMELIQFIHIDPTSAIMLIPAGFVGGMVSGFIGSGGAFVLRDYFKLKAQEKQGSGEAVEFRPAALPTCCV